MCVCVCVCAHVCVQETLLVCDYNMVPMGATEHDIVFTVTYKNTLWVGILKVITQSLRPVTTIA